MAKKQYIYSSALIILIIYNFSFSHGREFVYESNIQEKSINDACGLECWLGNLTITIPPQSQLIEIPIVDLYLNASIDQIECKGIQIGGINSSFLPPTTLNLLPYNVSITCQASWSVAETFWPYSVESGTFEAMVSNSSLLFGISLIKDPNDGLANSATTTVCGTDIQIPVINVNGVGTILQDLIDIFKGLIRSTIQSELDTLACTELTELVNNNLTVALQDVDVSIRQYMEPSPPLHAPPIPSEGILNLTQDAAIKLAGHMVHILFGSTGQLSFNMLVDHFTNNTGSLSLPPTLLSKLVFTVPVTMNNVSFANLTVGLLDFFASGLDTWGDVELSPEDNYTMRFHSDMSQLNMSATFFVNVSIGSAEFAVSETLYEEGTLIVSLSENNLNATVQLALIEKIFNSLQATQFMDIGCVLSALYNVNLTQLFFNMTTDQLAILAASGDIERDLDQLIDNVLALFTNSFRPAIPAFFNGFVATAIQQKANNFFAEELSLNETCPAPPATPAYFNQESGEITSIGLGTACFVLTVVMLFVQRKRVPAGFDDEVRPLLKLPDHKPSLAMHPKIPTFLRYAIPMVLFVNIALFISSNTSVGASVFVVLTAGTRRLQTPALFNFSLSNSIRDMWHAGVYPLSILIAVFSGGWPYLKLLIMLACWIIPVSVISEKKREHLLMALDMLGKWSLIDAFVMTLMIVAFQFHVASSAIPDTNPPEYGMADVFVEPHWGFYSFLLATMSSLALTHIILGLHNHATKADPENTLLEDKREALWHIAFRRSAFKRYLVAFLLLLSAGLISWGAYIYSFAFDFKGGAGWALQLTGQSTKSSYSLLSVGKALPEASPDPNYWGIRWIQVTFFTFTVVMPLAHLLTLFILWVTPLRPKAQRTVFVATEVFNAWSALEVFVVSIIAAVLEIRQFAQFIVGDKCDPINAILKEYFNSELEGDVKCFDVIATLESGCWVLFGGCIIYFGVAFVVMKKCHKTLDNYYKGKEDSSRSDLDISSEIKIN